MYIYRNVKNLILESKSALQSWSFINNYIGKEKLKHRTTEYIINIYIYLLFIQNIFPFPIG